MNEKRKIVLVGCGFVGMSMAYSFLNTGGIDELVLIDVDQEKAIGEAMDLQHGLPYARGKMSIKAGGYEECRDAAVVVITAGVTQKPTETRLDLTARDTVIMKSVTEQIMASGFDGILVIASNPVDAMTYVAQKVSGLPTERVIGSGTILDTARLRYMMSEYLDVSTSNIHAYIMGEHVILTVSAYQNNEYGQEGLYIGVPAVVNRQGIREIVKLDLNEVDQAKFNQSCETIRDINTDAVDPLL